MKYFIIFDVTFLGTNFRPFGTFSINHMKMKRKVGILFTHITIKMVISSFHKCNPTYYLLCASNIFFTFSENFDNKNKLFFGSHFLKFSYLKAYNMKTIRLRILKHFLYDLECSFTYKYIVLSS